MTEQSSAPSTSETSHSNPKPLSSTPKISKSTSKKHTVTFIENRAINYPSVTDFSAAAEELGWDFCHLTKVNSDCIARNDYGELPLDFVVYRSGENDYQETQRWLRWLHANHKITINSHNNGGYACAGDKHFQQGIYSLDPLLAPYVLPTFLAKRKSNVLSYIKGERLHFPIVLKDRFGTTGKNITLIRAADELDQISDFQNYLIEQYIEPECDFRIFVMGGVAVGLMQKYGDPDAPGNFVAWSGGLRRERVKDLPTIDILSEIATRASAASHTEYGGVDIVKERETGKFYILEINTGAGWLNVPPEFHLDIPKRMIEWMGAIADGREMSFADALEDYFKNYNRYLPVRIQKTIMGIEKGEPGVLEPYRKVFETYPQEHLYDAGYLFNRLADAYYKTNSINHQTPEQTKRERQEIVNLLHAIELTPFSWAGNFIGPNVGTFHDGAILSALYLYLRRQLVAQRTQN